MIDDIKYLVAAVDKLKDGQAETNVILARNTATLEEHVKRTNILEARVIPIEDHVREIQTTGRVFKSIGKAALWLGSLIGATAAAHSLHWL